MTARFRTGCHEFPYSNVSGKKCPIDCTGTDNGFAILNSDEARFGDELMYGCDLYYEVTSGDTLRYCQANQTWSGQPPTCSCE